MEDPSATGIRGLRFILTDFEVIGVSGSSLPAPQRERLVWEAARDPVGLSVCRLSVVTDIEVRARRYQNMREVYPQSTIGIITPPLMDHSPTPSTHYVPYTPA